MDFVFATEKGKRETNEDYYGQAGEKLFAVADGLGGFPAGEVASKLAVEGAVTAFEHSRDTINLEEIFQAANKAVFEKTQGNPKYWGMATTLVAVLFNKDKAWVGNVGDSRTHVFSKGKLVHATQDDREPFFGSLTKAVGLEREITPATGEWKVEKGDLVLLATDGLTDYVRDADIIKVLEGGKGLKEKAQELVNLALARGSTDNITVGLVRRI